MTRLKNGEDFATLARKESIDSTASEAGSLGEIAISALRPELQEALRGVAAGQASPIVKTAVLNAYYSLGEIYSYEGEMEHAVERYEKADEIASSK